MRVAIQKRELPIRTTIQPVVIEDSGKTRDREIKVPIPFEEGKDLEITLSEEVMQSSDVKGILAKGGSIGDLLVYDLIDEAIQQYEQAQDSYSKIAEANAKRGVSVKAFHHPLLFVMKDPLKVAADKAALQKGMIVKGNRILIPFALITSTLRPFLDKLLIPKATYTTRFVAPESRKKIEGAVSEIVTTKSAETSNKKYYVLGGVVLLTAGLTAFFMRRR